MKVALVLLVVNITIAIAISSLNYNPKLKLQDITIENNVTNQIHIATSSTSENAITIQWVTSFSFCNKHFATVEQCKRNTISHLYYTTNKYLLLSAISNNCFSFYNNDYRNSNNCYNLIDESLSSTTNNNHNESGNKINKAMPYTTYYNYTYNYNETEYHYKSGLLHNATLSNLILNRVQYYYIIVLASSNNGTTLQNVNIQQSTIHSFKTKPITGITTDNNNKKHTIGFVGDMGVKYNTLLTVNGLLKKKIDLLIHAGDVCYPDDDESPYYGEYAWDIYATLLQDVVSSSYYYISPGSHELYNNNIAFNNRYNMPTNRNDNCYYSFNYGLIHFISLSSEDINCASYYKNSTQYNWLENDLTNNLNRSITPWVVVYWHKPWYSSNNDSDAIEGESMRLSLEPLLYKHNIDLVINGHVHAYERTNKLFNHQIVDNGIVYITVGNSGESLYSTWNNPQPIWSSYRIAEYGFGILDVHNHTHAIWQLYLNNNSNYTIADSYVFNKL